MRGRCRDRRLLGVPAALVLLAGLRLALPGSAGAQHVEDLEELMRRAGVASLPGMTRPLPEPFRDAWAGRVRAAAMAGEAAEGSLPILLVPALFQDSEEPPSDTETLREIFFTGPSPRGSLPEFFEEASGGALTVTGDVAPWHRTGVDHLAATGGPDNVLGIGPELGAYLLEAIQAADEHLDFGQFDNDGPDGVPNSGDDDGRIDALAFVFQEVARSCGGPGVWPHAFALAPWNEGQPYLSDDTTPGGEPIEANGYVIVSARECDGAPVERVAVIAHELGHTLGQPDLYHPIGDDTDAFLPENRRWVVGCFGLMAGGSWGCGPADEFPAFGPTHFSPWIRDRLGWIELTTVAPDLRRAELVLDPVISSRSGLRIPLDPEGVESLLVEYRTREGFDAALPTAGVMIYRWNTAAGLRPPPAGPKLYRISLLEADGDSTLLRIHADGGNRGEISDVFATDGSHGGLSAGTHPGTHLADRTLTTVTIHGITIEEGRARLVVSTAPVPGTVTGRSPVSLTALEETELRVPLGGGALPYRLEVHEPGAPAGMAVTLDGDELMLAGAPRETGNFSITVTLTDALGTTATATAQHLVVARLAFSGSALMEGLVSPGSSALSPDERDLLDRDGNGNGRYDAGDLRAYLFGGG